MSIRRWFMGHGPIPKGQDTSSCRLLVYPFYLPSRKSPRRHRMRWMGRDKQYRTRCLRESDRDISVEYALLRPCVSLEGWHGYKETAETWKDEPKGCSSLNLERIAKKKIQDGEWWVRRNKRSQRQMWRLTKNVELACSACLSTII